MKSASADEQGGARAPLRDWELIIVDDGSGAQTRSYLEALQSFPKVRLIRLPHGAEGTFVTRGP